MSSNVFIATSSRIVDLNLSIYYNTLITLTCSKLIVTLRHGLEFKCVKEVLAAIHFASQHLNLTFLVKFLILATVVAGLLYFIIDLLELLEPLLDGRVELHGVLGCVAQCLFQVRDLSRELSLRAFILSVFLFDFGQVFELDYLPLKHTALHVLDHLLLLFAQLLVTELHAMDFLLHSNDLALTDVGVEGVLHFSLELDLSLP